MSNASYKVVTARPLFGPSCSWAYNLLRHVEPGTMLDIGAAKGVMTKRMLAASPGSTVFAYEPFPGNWPHFERDLTGVSGWTLIKKAVAEQEAQLPFHVPFVVGTGVLNWEDSVGYSSMGYLIPGGEKRVDFIVDAVRIDDEGYDHVRFMKIDVQGGEKGVIAGAQQMISNHSIDMIFLECDGDDPETIKSIIDHGYICLDGGYSIIHAGGRSLSNWEICYTTTTSTGLKMLGGWPVDRPVQVDEYCQWLVERRKNEGYTWNDLLFVSHRYVPSFLMAGASMVLAASANPKSTD